MNIHPLPKDQGVGFFSLEPVPDVEGYRYEQVGRYHNYYFTKENNDWPKSFDFNPNDYRIDGFSPNLNKTLHIGHLRNLALAVSLSRITEGEVVSLLGASLGILDEVIEYHINE